MNRNEFTVVTEEMDKNIKDTRIGLFPRVLYWTICSFTQEYNLQNNIENVKNLEDKIKNCFMEDELIDYDLAIQELIRFGYIEK